MDNTNRLRFTDILPYYLKYCETLASIINEKDAHNYKLLEIGCGAGDIVSNLIQKGYDTYGTDIEFKDGPKLKELMKEGKILKIGEQNLSRKSLSQNQKSYRLPFDQNTFDLTFSESTIEHVENLEDFISEAARVTKSNGVSIHYFPSKFSLVEPHIGIPLGGILKSRIYYKIMISFGFSFKRYQHAAGSDECIDFINTATFYHNRSHYIKLFEKYNFDLVHDSPEGVILAKAASGSKLAKILKRSTVLITLFKYFRSNVYILRKR